MANFATAIFKVNRADTHTNPWALFALDVQSRAGKSPNFTNFTTIVSLSQWENLISDIISIFPELDDLKGPFNLIYVGDRGEKLLIRNNLDIGYVLMLNKGKCLAEMPVPIPLYVTKTVIPSQDELRTWKASGFPDIPYINNDRQKSIESAKMGGGRYVDERQLDGDDDEQLSMEGSMEGHNLSTEWAEETPTRDVVLKSEEIDDWGKI